MQSSSSIGNFATLLSLAKSYPPIRAAVVVAEQNLVLETVADARTRGLINPVLIGDPDRIAALADDQKIDLQATEIVRAIDPESAASVGVDLVRNGKADTLMKGHIHTDTLMREILDKDHGLRVLGRRVSHVFMVDIATYPKLLAVTDAAINITPDLNAKAQILQNAVELSRVLGITSPKVAVISAVETVNPAIVSTLDAACLTLMTRRGQIAAGALVDGPMGFDNAISADAAREKGIISDVAGDVDILLVPDLVSGNILAKNLEYLAGGTAAGIVVGLSAPVVLSSRADPPEGRVAALALAVLIHARARGSQWGQSIETTDSAVQCAPQPEAACCPIGA